MQNGTAALEERQFLTKLDILLPCNPAVALFGIYPRELKTSVHTKTWTLVFISVLFIIAQTWKQPRCHSVGEWINKLWYIQAMERNELSGHEKTWRKLKCMLLTERSQSVGELTSSKWPYYPKQCIDSTQSLLKYPWCTSQTWSKHFKNLYGTINNPE